MSVSKSQQFLDQFLTSIADMGNNVKAFSRDIYNTILQQVKSAKCNTAGKSQEDHKLMKRYDIISIGDIEKLIKKRVNEDIQTTNNLETINSHDIQTTNNLETINSGDLQTTDYNDFCCICEWPLTAAGCECQVCGKIVHNGCTEHGTCLRCCHSRLQATKRKAVGDAQEKQAKIMTKDNATMVLIWSQNI